MNRKYSKVYPISGDDPHFQPSGKGKSNNVKSTLTKANLATATASASGSNIKIIRANNNNKNKNKNSAEQKQYDSECSSSIHSDDRIIQETKYPPNKQKTKQQDDTDTTEVDGAVKPYSKKRKPVVVSRDLQNQMIEEVLQQVLPSFGMYNNKDKEEFRPPDAFHIRWLKFIGCLSLDLHDAVLSGSLDEVERTLKKLCKGPHAKPELVNEYNSEGMTPLSIATKMNELDICAELVDHHAVIECPDQSTGRTPLFHAVQQRNHDLIFLFLKRGADPNAGDMQCITPLMMACGWDDYKTVKMLIKVNADVDLQDERGWTALHYAVYGNSVRSVALLLREGANRELKDMNGKVPLDFAEFRDHDQCISLLYQKYVPLV